MAKDTYLKQILGDERFQNIRSSKVLMVGVGGIGCELIKNLLLTGFGEVHIVDLDTITLSNLNRQFLFRQKDIDKSKALTTIKAVDKFNYFGCKLIAHHGNIMNTTLFPITWWDQFTYIYNALDNLEARRYVNLMALYLNKPLMESGTTGFEGQVQPIYPYQSECFDCQDKPTPTTFPVCTIRSTPSKPVHNITWAKDFLFNQLFDEMGGPPSDELADQRKQLEAETDDQQEIDNLLKETNELNDLRRLVSSVDHAAFINELIRKIFVNDIKRLSKIESLWKYRQMPIPLNFEIYKSELSILLENSKVDVLENETKVWSVVENLYVLWKSSEALATRITGGEKFISFDKDDDDTLNFVVAASNIRSHIFQIEINSKFDIKQIAGNIIPAIATTNAIISGFSGLQSLNYFKSCKPSFDQSSMIFVSIKPNQYIMGASLSKPNEKCASCSLSSRGLLSLDSTSLNNSLLWLVDLIKEKYEFEEISLILGKSRLIYDSDFDDNISKSLTELGFKNGETLLIQDEDDVLENLDLYILETSEFKLPNINPRPKVISPENHYEDDDDDLLADTPVDNIEDVVEIFEPPQKKQKVI